MISGPLVSTHPAVGSGYVTRRSGLLGKPRSRAAVDRSRTVSIAPAATFAAGPGAAATAPTDASPAWIVPSDVRSPGGTVTVSAVANACSPAATRLPAPTSTGKAVQLRKTTEPVAGSRTW